MLRPSAVPQPDSLAQAFGLAFLSLFAVIISWITVTVFLVFTHNRYKLPWVDVVVFAIIYPSIYFFYAIPVAGELFASREQRIVGIGKVAVGECEGYKNEQRRMCYWNAALKSGDVGLCEKIDKDLIKKLCIEDVEKKNK